MIVFQPCAWDLNKNIIKKFSEAIEKVYTLREELIEEDQKLDIDKLKKKLYNQKVNVLDYLRKKEKEKL